MLHGWNGWTLTLSALALALLTPLMAPAQDTVVGSEVQAKVMARRAAIADAQRQIAEIVYGAQIDSNTTVQNFVTQNDTIASRVRAVLRGAEVVDTRHMPDGSVEVDMELPARRLSVALQQFFPFPDDVIKATGVGVPNPVAQPEPEPIDVTPIPEPDPWYVKTIKATGIGVPPQGMPEARARAMARRAAKVDAYRNLVEMLVGANIDSQTTVKNFVTQDDTIRTWAQGYVRGAQEVDVRYMEDGSVEVDLEIVLTGLRDFLQERAEPKLQGMRIGTQSFILVIDASGSMKPRIEAARIEMRSLLSNLISISDPNDPYYINVISYTGQARSALGALSRLNRDTAGRLDGYLSRVQAGGNTNLRGAIQRAAHEVAGHGNAATLLVVTDAEDRTIEDLLANIREVKNMFGGVPVTIHATTPRILTSGQAISRPANRNEENLARLCREFGGVFGSVRNP